MSISILKAHHLKSIAVVLLLVLNGALLLRDHQKELKLVNAQMKLYDNQIELRVLHSERVFGSTFVSQFEAVDLQNSVSVIPYLGEQEMLILFFKPYDCNSCLEAMSSINSLISDTVPVIAVAHTDSSANVLPVVEKHSYEFPVYVTNDESIDLVESPYGVLVDKHKNIMHLSKINPDVLPVTVYITELKRIIERG